MDPLNAIGRFRERLRTRHYSYRTEESYADWARRFLEYLAKIQGTPHPHVDSESLQSFLTYLATRRQVSASTQNQALSALTLLCRDVLGVDVDVVTPAVRARRGRRLPVVLSTTETAALLQAMQGRSWLMAALTYGGGLRLRECCELRLKDIDFDQGLLLLRSGKGDKDRSTLLPNRCRTALHDQVAEAEKLHRQVRASVTSPRDGERSTQKSKTGGPRLVPRDVRRAASPGSDERAAAG